MNVTSADGSTIATHVTGSGPVIVIVDPAMSTSKSATRLSTALTGFTAVTFDRRGRGGSSDSSSAAVAQPQREVEDIEAVIDANGGSAILFGSSSGAALALEAATLLGSKVTGLVLYEPPFIVDGSRPPLAPDLPARVATLVADGRLSAAVKAFFIEAIGVPPFGVAIMRLLPLWRDAKSVVPTVRYDFAVLAGTQNGKPLPAERWRGMLAPGLVLVGSKSEAFFHAGAQALAVAVPSLRYEPLEGGTHGSPYTAPAGIAARIIASFLQV